MGPGVPLCLRSVVGRPVTLGPRTGRCPGQSSHPFKSTTGKPPAYRCLAIQDRDHPDCLYDPPPEAGSAPEALLTALFKHCDLSGVWKLRGAEGFGNFWCR
jgi:hypothetical protein